MISLSQIHDIFVQELEICAYSKFILQKLMNRCEKNVKDHQVYRDTFMEASDWLSCMVDRLNLCSDVRGDRTVVEAQLHKLQVKRFS